PQGRNPQVYNIDTETLSQNETSTRCEGHSFFPFYENYSIQVYRNDAIPFLEIPRYSHRTYTDAPPEGIELFTMTESGLCKWRLKKDIPLKLEIEKSNRFARTPLTIHKGDDFLMFWSDNPDGHNYLRAGRVNREGEWVIEPKNLYKKPLKNSVGDNGDICNFSFFQSDTNETTLVFSDRSYGKQSYNSSERYGDAIIVYKLNENLEITDSVVLTIDFPHFGYRFFRTHLLKKDSIYLLLAEVRHNGRHQLYYRLLNEDLTPKTDFVKLANECVGSHRVIGNPILTSEGFMMSWVDHDLSENVVRSIIIEPSGRQSNTINITNHKVDQIHNVEFDQNTVDIYLFSREEKSLIRKRINKREYGLPVNSEHGRWIPPRSEKQAYQEVRRHITRHMYWGEDEDGNPIILEAQDRGVGFPGGETARREYLNQNLKYPKSARRKGVQGTVRVEFWVDKDGSIREPKIDRGIREGCSWCNEEAIRLVQGMPKWLPETYNGNPVDVQIIMPIEFKIDPKGFLQKNEINVNTTAQGKRSRQRIRLNIFTGRIGGAKGLDVSVSGLYTATEGNINGVQLSGLANLRAKTDEGKIISNLLQYTDSSRTNGMQLSGLVNLGANMNGLQISGLLNSNKSLNGMSISGLGNSVDKQVNGIQVAGLVNHLDDEKGSINGIQLSGIVNFGMGKANGVQMSGFVNLALGGMNGIQVSSILNMTETLKGIQISGLLNVAGGMKGIQMSGLLNVAGGINGVQMSGIVNYGKGETKGVQIAGLFNNSDTLSGVSIAGIYNRAKVLNGVQIGLISKNDTIRRGGSLSLINIVKKGAYKGWELAFSDYANVALSYKMGTPKLYTIYSAGVHFLDDNFWVVGIGFGNRTYVGGKFFFRPELTYSNYFPINFKNIQHTSDTRLKLGFEYRINNKFSLSLAPSVYMMNARKGSNPESEYYRISPIEALYTQERGNRQTVVGVGISVGLSLK
ncbi:MAG: energy transducer TonB, partial [Bacteroidales bacterium]|nr:energy transducer TonB [Bacteroidales bacterium]